MNDRLPRGLRFRMASLANALSNSNTPNRLGKLAPLPNPTARTQNTLFVSTALSAAIGWSALLAIGASGQWYTAVDTQTGQPIAEPLPQAMALHNTAIWLAAVGLVTVVMSIAWRPVRGWAVPSGVLLCLWFFSALRVTYASDAVLGIGRWHGNGLLGGEYFSSASDPPVTRFAFDWRAGTALGLVAFLTLCYVAQAAALLIGRRKSVRGG